MRQLLGYMLISFIAASVVGYFAVILTANTQKDFCTDVVLDAFSELVDQPPPKCNIESLSSHWQFKGEGLVCMEIMPWAYAWVIISR